MVIPNNILNLIYYYYIGTYISKYYQYYVSPFFPNVALRILQGLSILHFVYRKKVNNFSITGKGNAKFGGEK